MKKIVVSLVAALMCVVMMFTLTSCSGGLEAEFQGDYKSCVIADLDLLYQKLKVTNGDAFSSISGGYKMEADINMTDIDVVSQLCYSYCYAPSDAGTTLALSMKTETKASDPNAVLGSVETSLLGIGKEEVAMYYKGGVTYTATASTTDGDTYDKTPPVQDPALQEASIQAIQLVVKAGLAQIDYSSMYMSYMEQAIADNSLLSNFAIAHGKDGTIKLRIRALAEDTITSENETVKSDEDGYVYLSFASDYTLRGLKIDVVANTETTQSGISFVREGKIDISMVIVPFTGTEVEVPSQLSNKVA